MGTIDISNKEFNTLSHLIYEESGINIHIGKMELLKSKIAKRMRSTKISSSRDYLNYLMNNKAEVIEFIDTVTTNHSFFFRENASIQKMVQALSLANAQSTPKTFKIWCAASSTGDEPYSVAVQMIEASLQFKMLATDISHSVLNTAMRGVYSQERVRNVPVAILHKYFQKGLGKSAGLIRVKKEIMRHIDFQKFNLITDPIPDEKFDVILCRNVMIYFDEPTTEKVVNRLYNALKIGGFFIIGQAESLMNLKHHFKAVKNTPSTFQK
ncbi:MAG: protein-glutamate O-methyltransferase CheR [Desulfamplus sp.]|nr:protein-glutamate O-methyltransferase CheR [Desulfamplus sp.]MBF0390042.1 protein-glutamate O-methyltransferase CheR [Desulfamplus sp.]